MGHREESSGRARGLGFPLALAGLAIGIFLPPRVLHANEYRKTSHYKVRLFSVGTLSINARFGDIEIRGWNEPYVEVRAVKLVRAGSRAKAQKLYAMIHVRIEGRDKFVRLDTLYPPRRLWRPFHGESRLTVNYHIRMPYDSKLVLECVDGDVTVHGVTGRENLMVNYGDVEISIPSIDHLRSLNAHSWLGYVQADFNGMEQDDAGFAKRLRFWNPMGKQDITVRVHFGAILVYDEL